MNLGNMTDSCPVLSGTSIAALKRLLTSIADAPHASLFRYRLMGEMWQSGFMDVLQVSGTGVLLNDRNKGKHVLLTDLKNIAQFELDSAHSSYQPHCHYDVASAFHGSHN